jgi:hypothetical protein
MTDLRFDESRVPTRVEPQAAIAEIVGGDGGREAVTRTAADDMRVALHESNHAVVGRLLGQPLGGVTINAGDGFSDLCWGPTFQSKFTGGPSPSSLCAQIGRMMPAPGESRNSTADIFLHVHNRCTELVAGSVGEALFLPGLPWDAVDDRAQERALASLICSSPEAAKAFIDFCAIEAAALLRPREHIVRALTKALLIRRAMTGAEVDTIIAAAVSAKSAEDERQRRADWEKRRASAAWASA